MKKLLLILVVLGVAAPSVAGTINFAATDDGANGTCTITYYVTGGGVAPVAMGLEVEVTSGNPIKNVTDMDSFFDIYMDYAYDDPCNYTYGAGHPIADPCGPGAITLPQSKFVISMGGLGGPTKPPTKFPKMGTKKDPVVVAVLHSDGGSAGVITVNVLRGGVIDEDAEPMDPNGPTAPDGDLQMPFTISECMPLAATTADFGWLDRPVDKGSTTYAEWAAVGKPRCWCYQAQCRGNADGITNGSSKAGYYHVGTDDFNTIVAAWDTTVTPQFWVKEPTFGPGIGGLTGPTGVSVMCANFNRTVDGSSKAGYYYVGTNDFNRIVAAWDITITPQFWTKEPTFGPGIPTGDCGGSLIGP